jgi:hypothetical protein
MANKFTRFLGDNLTGALSPKGNLADYQHASRLYVDDTFRLAPKTKFLYYAVFNINPTVLKNGSSFKDRHILELNYLVKSMDLPKFTMETTPLNQYNRKTTTYTKIAYDPVSLTFHDDNNGVTNALWALYYGYYFRDRFNSSQPYEETYPVAYQNTTYVNKSQFPFRYGLDNDSVEPFFHSIQLFTLSRQKFFSYMLCNPKITSWQHDNMTQSENGGQVENKLSVVYDAVIYNSGEIEVDNPAGFATLHYDNTPSPIGNDLIVNDGIEGVFGDVFSKDVFSGPATYFNRIRNTLQQYVNLGNQGQFGGNIPSLFSLTNSSFDSVGGLGDIKIAKFSGDEPIFDSMNFSSEGIAKPSNGTGGITRENLPPIDKNRVESIQQDWNTIDQSTSTLPLPSPPLLISQPTPAQTTPVPQGSFEPDFSPQPNVLSDPFSGTYPTTRPQAQENRIAQGTIIAAGQNGNIGPVSPPTTAQAAQTLSGNFSLEQFRQRDPEGAREYEARVAERTRELTRQYLRPTTSQNPAIINLIIDSAERQARARAEVEALSQFAPRINSSGAGNLRTPSTVNTIPSPVSVPSSVANPFIPFTGFSDDF